MEDTVPYLFVNKRRKLLEVSFGESARGAASRLFRVCNSESPPCVVSESFRCSVWEPFLIVADCDRKVLGRVYVNQVVEPIQHLRWRRERRRGRIHIQEDMPLEWIIRSVGCEGCGS